MGTVIYVRSFLNQDALNGHLADLKTIHNTNNITYKLISRYKPVNCTNIRARFYNLDWPCKIRSLPKKIKALKTDKLSPLETALILASTKYRLENKLTQKSLANLIGCSTFAYVRFENGFVPIYVLDRVSSFLSKKGVNIVSNLYVLDTQIDLNLLPSGITIAV